MTAHTPGPWKAYPAEQGWATVLDRMGNIVANVNTDTGPDIYPMVSRKMPAESNARLIAAAPELLEALEALTEWGCTYTSPHDANSPHELLIAARAASAKARGES